jgi:KDO2-lipid IV(A) lauroyltransferase
MSNTQDKAPNLLAPRHWPTWFGLSLGWIISQLPYGLQMLLGRGLGKLCYWLLKSRRHVVEVNLRLAFPKMSEPDRAEMVRAHFSSAGQGIIETLLCWWGSNARVKKLAHFEGLEHLQAAIATGRGILLLSAHFTSLELGVRMSTMHADVTAMYRPPNNPVIDRVMRASRERHVGKDVIPKSNIRGLIRSLREGQAVWYAPDQSARNKFSAMVPFFGVPAMTNLATNRLAKMSNAIVLPFFTLRRDDGQGYRVLILPPLADFPGDDEIADALRVNQVIEKVVKEAPEQYFWLHRRFKRDDGIDPYAQQ